MDGHKSDIVVFNKDPHANTKKAQTALDFEDGHAPDIDNVSMLMVEPNEFKRKILESLEILTHKTMNSRLDAISA